MQRQRKSKWRLGAHKQALTPFSQKILIIKPK
jgi:hypothetical protein